MDKEQMLVAIRQQLQAVVDTQMAGIEACIEDVQLKSNGLSDAEILNGIMAVMQQVTGITQQTMEKQLRDTRATLDSMREDIFNKLAKGEIYG